MKVYGISIPSPGGHAIFVYFHPLSYSDWVAFRDPEDMLDPASVRYLIRQYVVRAFVRTQEGDSEMTSEELEESDAQIIKTVLDRMMMKSGFSDDAETDRKLALFERQSKTLLGAYNSFLLAHCGVEVYLRLLDADHESRLHVIAEMQSMTQINVRSRFEDSVKNRVPLDVVHNDEDYIKMRKRFLRGQSGQPQVSGVEERETPGDLNSMLAASSEALSRDIQNGRRNPSKVFNWNMDDHEYDRQVKIREAEIMNQEVQGRPDRKTFGGR